LARLYPVAPLWDAARLWRRGRLGLGGRLVVEEKLDGVLVVGYDGGVYTGSGRRAPGWVLRGLEEAGADVAGASRGGRLVYVELYGACVRGETGLWRRYRGCFRAAFLDAARAPAHAGPVWEAAWAARAVGHPERLGYAEAAGLEQPRRVELELSRGAPPEALVDLLGLYPGSEGVVVKLYRDMGHRLPPEYGAKARGELAVKLRWEWFAERWR
jgi:hypothetical protein